MAHVMCVQSGLSTNKIRLSHSNAMTHAFQCIGRLLRQPPSHQCHGQNHRGLSHLSGGGQEQQMLLEILRHRQVKCLDLTTCS